MKHTSSRIPRKTGLIDCGSASEKTKGLPFLLLFEVSWPPFDRLFLI